MCGGGCRNWETAGHQLCASRQPAACHSRSSVAFDIAQGKGREEAVGAGSLFGARCGCVVVPVIGTQSCMLVWHPQSVLMVVDACVCLSSGSISITPGITLFCVRLRRGAIGCNALGARPYTRHRLSRGSALDRAQ